MKTKLNHELIKELVRAGHSYKEIVEITGYNKNSVYGWCLRHFGKLDDKLASRRQVLSITQEQKEFIFGTLMGDANLRPCGKHNIYGRTNHSITQESYCIHKQKILCNLTYPVKYTTKNLPSTNKLYQQCYFCFKPNTELIPIYNLFYKDGKKDVPEDLTLLTPKALAWWFMDDGTASGNCSISIATCSFSLEGLLRLQKYLKDKYEISTTIQKDFKLYFHTESAIKFYNLTKDYIIEEMKYKFRFIKSLSADLKLR